MIKGDTWIVETCKPFLIERHRLKAVLCEAVLNSPEVTLSIWTQQVSHDHGY